MTITIRELATVFGIDRSGLLKWAKRVGAELVWKRDPATGNQRERAVTSKEARRLIKLRRADGYRVNILLQREAGL